MTLKSPFRVIKPVFFLTSVLRITLSAQSRTTLSPKLPTNSLGSPLIKMWVSQYLTLPKCYNGLSLEIVYIFPNSVFRNTFKASGRKLWRPKYLLTP